MIQAHPWTGHGIGTFPTQELRYALPGDSRSYDPNASLPQLPHNILLQLAAEQGVPAVSLFIALVGWLLWRGIRCWITARRMKARAPPEAGPLPQSTLLALALTLSLAAYLQANMTWDILLVHPTQPFIFWFLIAALASITDQVKERKAALG